MTPPAIMRHATDMRGALAARLRRTFVPMGLPAPVFEASVVELLARIDRVGADRPPQPFRHDPSR